jgi:hypothetical protein
MAFYTGFERNMASAPIGEKNWMAMSILNDYR